MRTLFIQAARISSAVALSTGLMLLGTPDGWAQQKAGASAKQLVGTWTLVSVSNIQPDGKMNPQAFGPNPEGMLTFDAKGRYSLQICRSGRAKFASNVRD